jgi:hypothetical protein
MNIRDEEICKLKQGYGNTMMQVEGQVKTRTEEIYKKDNEIYELKVSIFYKGDDLYLYAANSMFV